MKLTLLFLLLLSSCSHLFYHPAKGIYLAPEKLGINYSNLTITTSDNIKLHAWHLKSKAKKKKGLIVHFHGNAENISTHYLHLTWILEHGHDVIIFDYRGYGESEGKPNQKGTYLDALAVLEYAYKLKKKGLYPKLTVFAQSLGGVIALRSIADFKEQESIDLIAVDSTFLSYKSAAFSLLANSWITFLISPLAYILVSDEMEAETTLNKINSPLLVIHGEKDSIVPFSKGQEIYDKFQGKKWLWKIPEGVHINVFWNQEQGFREKYLNLLENI